MNLGWSVLAKVRNRLFFYINTQRFDHKMTLMTKSTTGWYSDTKLKKFIWKMAHSLKIFIFLWTRLQPHRFLQFGYICYQDTCSLDLIGKLSTIYNVCLISLHDQQIYYCQATKLVKLNVILHRFRQT